MLGVPSFFFKFDGFSKKGLKYQKTIVFIKF